jgi:hypothetical protein
MPTFIFTRAKDGRRVHASAHSLNLARDYAEGSNPSSFQLHDAAQWPVSECWVGGECVWHYDAQGDLVQGPRPRS